jgi:hypothetical protein
VPAEGGDADGQDEVRRAGCPAVALKLTSALLMGPHRYTLAPTLFPQPDAKFEEWKRLKAEDARRLEAQGAMN